MLDFEYFEEICFIVIYAVAMFGFVAYLIHHGDNQKKKEKKRHDDDIDPSKFTATFDPGTGKDEYKNSITAAQYDEDEYDEDEYEYDEDDFDEDDEEW